MIGPRCDDDGSADPVGRVLPCDGLVVVGDGTERWSWMERGGEHGNCLVSFLLLVRSYRKCWEEMIKPMLGLRELVGLIRG